MYAAGALDSSTPGPSSQPGPSSAVSTKGKGRAGKVGAGTRKNVRADKRPSDFGGGDLGPSKHPRTG